MSMTREEAINRIKDHMVVHHIGEYPHIRLKEALDMALTALRPVSREQVEKVWSPCNFCAGAKYITGGVTAVYPLSETRQQETLAEGDFDFCPVCGRPLTDEAVQMVMERMEEIEDGTVPCDNT